MNDLFGALDPHGFVQEELAPGAILLRGKAYLHKTVCSLR